MNHENSLIDAFVLKQKKERYLKLLSTKKGRLKFRKAISHFADLDIDFTHRIAGKNQNRDDIYNLLLSKGSPSFCYIIADYSNYDQKEMELLDATKELIGSGISFFLSCIPGKLVYYEGEDIGERFLLLK